MGRVIANFDAISAGDVPESFTSAVTRTKTLALAGPGAGSGFAETFVDSGGTKSDFNDTFAVFVYGLGVPRLPLPVEVLNVNGYHGVFLDRDDPSGVMLGELTNCCQTVGGAGHDAAVHGQSDPRGGFFAVTDKRGNVVAQSWVWLDRDSRAWCFDNIEMLEDTDQGGGSDAKTARKQRRETVARVYQQAGQALADLTGLPVTVGEGYSDKGLMKHFAGLPESDWADTSMLGYTDADTGQRLVAAAPETGAPAWVMRDVLDGSGASGQVTWERSDGPTVSVTRQWDGAGAAAVTLVTVGTPRDTIDPDVAVFAEALAGTDPYTIVNQAGHVLAQGPGSGRNVTSLVGEKLIQHARTYGGSLTEGDTHFLRVLTLLAEGWGDVLDLGATSDQVNQLQRAGTPAATVAAFLTAGGTGDQAVTLHTAGADLMGAASFLESGGTGDQAVTLHEAGADLNEAAWFLRTGGTFDQVLTLHEAGANHDDAAWLIMAGGTFDQVLTLHMAGADLMGAGRFLDYGGTFDQALTLHGAGADLYDAAEFLESGGTGDQAVTLHKAGADLSYAAEFLRNGGTFEELYERYLPSVGAPAKIHARTRRSPVNPDSGLGI